MCRFVAVVDLGKSNSKVALVDTHVAKELTVVTQAAATRQDKLYPCLDEQEIERFILGALRELRVNFQIDAITVTTHGATVALLNAKGDLALPVMDYEFAGVDEFSEQYETLRPEFKETGSPRLPGGLNIGAQLFWQSGRFPVEFAQVTSILTWPQYWVYKLCDIRSNDVSSLGAHSDLYDPHQQCVSSLVVSQGWNVLMPDTQQSGKLSGYLNKDICRQTGLAETTGVYTGIHDSNASLVPHLLANDRAFSVISSGTWTICMSIGGDDVELDETRDCLYNVNAYGMPVASARFMGGRERELILQYDDATTEPAPALPGITLSQLATRSVEQVPMVMPTASPHTGPFPTASWRWIGEVNENEHSEKQMCVSLYLALMSAQCLELIGSKGSIHVEGPLAHDELYCQMLMATTCQQVIVSESVTGTSVGAAMLITQPHLMPASKVITLDTTGRQWLSRYAKRWRGAVEEHLHST